MCTICFSTHCLGRAQFTFSWIFEHGLHNVHEYSCARRYLDQNILSMEGCTTYSYVPHAHNLYYSGWWVIRSCETEFLTQVNSSWHFQGTFVFLWGSRRWIYVKLLTRFLLPSISLIVDILELCTYGSVSDQPILDIEHTLLIAC